MMFTHPRGTKTGHLASPLFRYVTQHAVLLMVLALVGTGIVGGSVLGLSTFAAGPCRAGDQTYYVRWGDTLGAIAARYRSSVAGLANYNHIYNVNLIFAGERLCILGGAAPVSSGGTTVVFQNGYVGVARQEAYNAGIS